MIPDYIKKIRSAIQLHQEACKALHGRVLESAKHLLTSVSDNKEHPCIDVERALEEGRAKRYSKYGDYGDCACEAILFKYRIEYGRLEAFGRDVADRDTTIMFSEEDLDISELDAIIENICDATGLSQETPKKILHLYLCDFHVSRGGMPAGTFHRYVEAGNTQDAYVLAQRIRSSSLFRKSPDDKVSCLRVDIHQSLKDEALKEITKDPELLVRRYKIRKEAPGHAEETCRSFYGSVSDALRGLRDEAFDRANSGHYGPYPTDINQFNKLVEKGFSQDGLSWESENGIVLTVVAVS